MAESVWRILNGVLFSYSGKGGRVKLPRRVKKIGDGAFLCHDDIEEIVLHRLENFDLARQRHARP